jgi:hypothetical protein
LFLSLEYGERQMLGKIARGYLFPNTRVDEQVQRYRKLERGGSK